MVEPRASRMALVPMVVPCAMRDTSAKEAEAKRRDAVRALHKAVDEPGGGRVDLGVLQLARFVIQGHYIREGAADVDADSYGHKWKAMDRVG